jgi:hypothetical protein
MPKKQRKFADDGLAIWVDGEDVSTVYINDWLNPKGKSYVDVAVRIRGVKSSKTLNIYVPFFVSNDEIEDVSLLFEDKGILQVQAVSALPLTDSQKMQLTDKLAAITGKEIDLVCKVDPSVLGGIRLSYGGIQVDGTVQSRLQAMEKRLKNTVL